MPLLSILFLSLTKNQNIMPFKKGVSGNPNGRPKKSVNKITKDMKQSFGYLVDSNLKDFQKDLNKMKPKDKWELLLKLSDKLLPNLKSVESKVENTIQKPQWIDNLKELNDNQIDLILKSGEDE